MPRFDYTTRYNQNTAVSTSQRHLWHPKKDQLASNIFYCYGRQTVAAKHACMHACKHAYIDLTQWVCYATYRNPTPTHPTANDPLTLAVPPNTRIGCFWCDKKQKPTVLSQPGENTTISGKRTRRQTTKMTPNVPSPQINDSTILLSFFCDCCTMKYLHSSNCLL